MNNVYDSSFDIECVYRFLSEKMIKTIYNTKFIGFEKIPKDGPGLIISNHVSFMDGLVIQAATKRQIRFVIDKHIYMKPFVHYFMKHNRAIPISATKEDVQRALEEATHGLEQGDLIGIFPEGQITYTGNLGRFKPGIEWIIERDPVPIYPVALQGLWGSIFSRKYLRTNHRWIPKTFRRSVTAICGDEVHPEHVKVNTLQNIILHLKNSV